MLHSLIVVSVGRRLRFQRTHHVSSDTQIDLIVRARKKIERQTMDLIVDWEAIVQNERNQNCRVLL